MTEKEHFAIQPDRDTSLAGRKYRGFGGGVYELLSHHRCGYHLKLIEAASDDPISRKVGDFACISERAIGRTYHEVHDLSEAE